MEETGQGAEPWTVAQLNDMMADEVKMCQKALGSRTASSDKLSVVWTKLKEVGAAGRARLRSTLRMWIVSWIVFTVSMFFNFFVLF